MTKTLSIPFLDPRAGDSVALLQLAEDAIGISFSNPSGRSAEVFLSASDAIRLARAILATVGETERPVLPHSRQIGGIIGPY
jgi:hypothetical protein